MDERNGRIIRKKSFQFDRLKLLNECKKNYLGANVVKTRRRFFNCIVSEEFVEIMMCAVWSSDAKRGFQ